MSDHAFGSAERISVKRDMGDPLVWCEGKKWDWEVWNITKLAAVVFPLSFEVGVVQSDKFLTKHPDQWCQS